MSPATLFCGDALDVLKTLPSESVQCVVTSPPYWGLRDYGVPGQLGLEDSPDKYVARLVEVFREVRQVLRDDGTLWLNLGDSYTGSGKGGNPDEGKQATNKGSQSIGVLYGKTGASAREAALTNVSRRWTSDNGMAPKNLVGIPWRVAFALQADGWYLRSDIIWAKPNPMPESVTDRPTKAHEYVFLLSKSERYFYDAAAIAERCDREQYEHNLRYAKEYAVHTANANGHQPGNVNSVGIHARAAKLTRNARTVWEIATQPYPEAHFATFPEELARRCILAGSRPGDTVLDPFGGSGTVAQVATGHGRNSIYIDLNPKYLELARQRIGPMLCESGASRGVSGAPTGENLKAREPGA